MSKASNIYLDAGVVYTPFERIAPGRLVIEGAKIREVGPLSNVAVPDGAFRIDAMSFVAAPGFIEPHIHGCGGADAMRGDRQSLEVMSRTLARHGVTSFLPTTVSAARATLSDSLRKLGQAMAFPFEGAQPVGIHLEGPFISSEKRGAHKAGAISMPDPASFEEWLEASGSNIRLATLAPELPGADSIIDCAKRRGVVAAMGHSNASFDEATAAISKGVQYATHTFNAMRQLDRREPGVLGAVLTDDRVFAEIIADGVHTHPAIVKLFARVKNTERILLTTDAISATDMPDGRHTLGAETVIVKDGVCRDEEGRLAGSTLTQERALRNFIAWTGFSFQEAVRTLTSNPAKALGLQTKGRLAPGSDADIVVLDDNWNVVRTLAMGRPVFDRTLWTN